MGTLMEDKIKKAFEEWKGAETKSAQPKEESNMESTIQPEPKTSTRNGVLTQFILGHIHRKPGITGRELRVLAQVAHPEIPPAYVPAILKHLYDNQHVSRTEVTMNSDLGPRTTFAYYMLSAAERDAAVKQRKAVKKTKKRTVQAKAKPATVKEEPTTEIVPVPQPKRHAAHALEVGSATISIAIATSDGTSYSLTLPEAKYIYTQLNQIFGAVR